MKAVVLDSDPIARRLLEEALGRAGHELRFTEDGQQALRWLAEEPRPELAFVDWRAAGMDGVEICRRLRRLGPEAPYLVLLGVAGETDAAPSALAVGADDLLLKPLRLDELELRLRLGVRTQSARLEVVRLRNEVARRSQVDQLTGVEDRMAITQRLEGELSRSQRGNAPLSILLVDIDQFRNINELFGHEAGDSVLTGVAARIRRVLRRYDSLGRFGAEEFLVLLPGCGPDHTHALSERLLRSITADPIPTQQGRVAATCSVGALCLPFAEGDVAPEVDEVLLAVERAARDAKLQGGDQAVVLSLRPGAMADG
ncbi:MAG: diguanylate cyclase [Deltaproteobacteria bacterium]|nr:diguanylate cyclase [Deltaproteobacteria bacterium]